MKKKDTKKKSKDTIRTLYFNFGQMFPIVNLLQLNFKRNE